MQRTQAAGTTFVLVHGSWHGGWCWNKVTPWLRRAGDTVYTPTLTGMAGPGNPPARDVGLETHVRDVVALCRNEDLRDIVLVGHSYGGLVITGAAETISDRVRRLVYLDAFVPADGESMFNRLGSEQERYFRGLVTSAGDGWLVPPFTPGDMGVTDPLDVAWMQPQLVAVPVATFEQPVHLPTGAATRLPRSYIWCNQSPMGHEAHQAQAAGWDYHELPTGHDGMMTLPEALATTLRACAALAPETAESPVPSLGGTPKG